MFISGAAPSFYSPRYLPKCEQTLQISPDTPAQPSESSLTVSREDGLSLSFFDRLIVTEESRSFSLRILNAVSSPDSLSSAAEAALTRIELMAGFAVRDSRLETSASLPVLDGVPPEKALDDVAAEYGERKIALNAFYSDESLNALLDGMAIEDADERASILAVLKDIYAVRDAELTAKYTEYAKRRIDGLCPGLNLSDEWNHLFPSFLGITETSFRTAMEAVWQEKMEIAPKLAATADKENLAAVISQYSLENSTVTLNIDGFDFSYKNVMAIMHIYKGENAACLYLHPPTFESVNMRAAAAQLIAENTMSTAAAEKFMEIYEKDLYARAMEEAAHETTLYVRQFYSKALGISVSPEKLERILQELNDQAKLFRVLATVPAESFKDSFQETIRAFTEVAWKYNKQVDVAGLVKGWNAYLKYSKSDFADLSGYEIKTAVDIRA